MQQKKYSKNLINQLKLNLILSVCQINTLRKLFWVLKLFLSGLFKKFFQKYLKIQSNPVGKSWCKIVFRRILHFFAVINCVKWVSILLKPQLWINWTGNFLYKKLTLTVEINVIRKISKICPYTIRFQNASEYDRFWKRLIEKLLVLFGYYLQLVRNVSDIYPKGFQLSYKKIDRIWKLSG